MSATSIKQLIQEIIQRMLDAQVPTITQGVVTGTEPLQITLVNNLAVNLSNVSLTIPDRLQPLSKGEAFYMLSTNRNKMYYLLDRV